jgi:triosephosphate isomerase (TIM)
MKNKKIIAGNWKMNPLTLNQAIGLARKTLNIKKNNCEVIIFPPLIFLNELNNYKKIKIGAQNFFWEKEGSFTGEVSAEMVKSIGCSYVLVGHSERRCLFNETDEIINKKIKSALKLGLKIIFCIGERYNERKKAKEVIYTQIKKGLKGLSSKETENIILAYEPVWAIGSGHSCNPILAKEMKIFIEKKLKKMSFNETKIIYGGSVNYDNSIEYLNFSDFDGLLIGGASLKNDFISIINNIK